MDKNEECEDSQRTFVENASSISNKKTLVENEKNTEPIILWKDLYPQISYCCIVLFMATNPGIHLAFSNNLLYHMPSLNKGEFSWITSILALFTPVGSLFIGFIIDRIGRKKACLLTCVTLLMSWILAAFTSPNSIYLFLVSRILGGIGAGMTTVSLIYVSEISHPSYKQLFLSLNSVFFSGGVLLSTFMVWLELYVINLVFIGLTFVNIGLIILYVPESPIWLFKFKSPAHVTKARAAVKRIYPRNRQVFKFEWNRLQTSTGNESTVDDDDRPSFFESLRSSPAAYKPFGIMLGLLFLQQATGAYAIITYALSIYKSIVPDASSESEVQSVAVLGTVRFAGALLITPLSRYVGRKPLLTLSCIGMTLSAAFVAITVHVQPKMPQPTNDDATSLLTLFGIMLYVFSSSLGVLVFPWTLVCELLSTPVRAVGGCLLVAYAYILMFFVLKAFLYIWAALGVSGAFTVFSIVSLAMAAYVQLVLPETLGKTFEEIENYFIAGTNSKT